MVCSAHEVSTLRNALGPNFILMVPGIRPEGSDVGDQKRVMTPSDALKAGSSHLVVARPIVNAVDPLASAKAILAEMDGALTA